MAAANITTSYPIASYPKAADGVLVAMAIAYTRAAGAHDPERTESYVRELARLARTEKLSFLALFGQWADETDIGRSALWDQGNPAGIGIESSASANPLGILTGPESARAHVTAMAMKVDGAPRKSLAAYEPLLGTWFARSVAKRQSGAHPAIQTIADLSKKFQYQGGTECTWACNQNYASQIAGHMRAAFGEDYAGYTFTPAAEGGGNMPQPALYAVAGLSVKIASLVPIIIDLIPLGQTNQRPGYQRQLPGYWVQHETDNYTRGAGASMHNTYLHNGAGGQVASWHFSCDSGVIYQHLPVNEVGWHAADGGGPGNMSGVACELCVNVDSDMEQARHNAEYLCGGVVAALGLTKDRIKRHWDFNEGDPDRHHCPDNMMNDGYWSTFVANSWAVAQSGTVPTTPAPQYAAPVTYPWLTDGSADGEVTKINNTTVHYIRLEYTAIRDTKRLQGTGLNHNEVGKPIKKGETFWADRAYRSYDKSTVLTPAGTRVMAADLEPRIGISKDTKDAYGTVSIKRKK